jgi:hypothetical protein
MKLKKGIESLLHVAPSAEVAVVNATTATGKSSYCRSLAYHPE